MIAGFPQARRAAAFREPRYAVTPLPGQLLSLGRKGGSGCGGGEGVGDGGGGGGGWWREGEEEEEKQEVEVEV